MRVLWPPTRARAAASAAPLLLAALLAAACTAGSAPPGPYGPPPRVPSDPGLPGRAYEVGLAADGSGFALLAQCVTDPARPELGFCRQLLAVLDPGAGEWVPRRSPLPELRGTEGVSAVLRPLGPGRALLEDGGGDRPERTWYTGDGGRSWRAVDRRPAGRTPDIPADAVLTTDCPGQPGAAPELCARERLVVISPRDGRRRALVRQPPVGAHPRPAETAEPDGSWWVSGVEPSSGRPVVAVSRDAGRSWRVSRLPSPVPAGSAPGRHVRVAVGPDAVYAAELGELTAGEPERNPLRALHRSPDGGVTWERVWTTGERAEPRSLLGTPVPGPGGRVEIDGERRRYRSEDGGRTFREVDEGSRHTRRTALGLLREGAACAYELSRDGVRWSEFRLACEESGPL